MRVALDVTVPARSLTGVGVYARELHRRARLPLPGPAGLARRARPSRARLATAAERRAPHPLARARGAAARAAGRGGPLPCRLEHRSAAAGLSLGDDGARCHAAHDALPVRLGRSPVPSRLRRPGGAPRRRAHRAVRGDPAGGRPRLWHPGVPDPRRSARNLGSLPAAGRRRPRRRPPALRPLIPLRAVRRRPASPEESRPADRGHRALPADARGYRSPAGDRGPAGARGRADASARPSPRPHRCRALGRLGPARGSPGPLRGCPLSRVPVARGRLRLSDPRGDGVRDVRRHVERILDGGGGRRRGAARRSRARGARSRTRSAASRTTRRCEAS